MAPILVIVEAPLPRRKHQDFGPRVPENKQLHIAVQMVAEPLVISAIHLLSE
jgi:hypothetical protein